MVTCLCTASAAVPIGGNHIHRQIDLDALGLGLLKQRVGGFQQIILDLGGAHAVALAFEEGVGHGAADDQLIDPLQHVAQGLQLARNLGGLGFRLIRVEANTFWMHDGRAKSIEEAINLHGGEGQRSKDNFQQLSSAEKQKLIKFLESL